ncbi:hypothetical protein ACIHEJ_35135 [Streptomyces sp. NPDC052301]|uniref:hypothetical protein n=1 Tax=Streptomyces sp. NPDC052301 TaxID=3365687 RepID=UPI0037D2F1D7
MPAASIGSGWQQQGQPLPQVVRNKISTHADTLPTKITERKTHSSTHFGTVRKPPTWPFKTFGGPRGFGTYWRDNGMSGS